MGVAVTSRGSVQALGKQGGWSCWPVLRRCVIRSIPTSTRLLAQMDLSCMLRSHINHGSGPSATDLAAKLRGGLAMVVTLGSLSRLGLFPSRPEAFSRQSRVIIKNTQRPDCQAQPIRGLCGKYPAEENRHLWLRGSRQASCSTISGP